MAESIEAFAYLEYSANFAYLECSAKSKDGVREVFETAPRAALQNQVKPRIPTHPLRKSMCVTGAIYCRPFLHIDSFFAVCQDHNNRDR